MFVKPLYDKEEYDIFLGSGWDNWVRVRVLPRDRTVEVLDRAVGVAVTDRLKELIFYKTRKTEKDWTMHLKEVNK